MYNIKSIWCQRIREKDYSSRRNNKKKTPFLSLTTNRWRSWFFRKILFCLMGGTIIMTKMIMVKIQILFWVQPLKGTFPNINKKLMKFLKTRRSQMRGKVQKFPIRVGQDASANATAWRKMSWIRESKAKMSFILLKAMNLSLFRLLS